VVRVEYYLPKLDKTTFEKIQHALNVGMSADMVQHGSEAQYKWHGDEPITVVFPNWRFLFLHNAEAVLGWYEDFARDVITKKGERRPDYRRDPRRTFFVGPEGIT
jgi:hypothetical protein